MLWIDVEGNPMLWRRVQTSRNEDGTGDLIDAYIAAELYDWPDGVPIPDHLARGIAAEPLAEMPAETVVT